MWWKGGWSLVLLAGSVNAGCSGYKPVRSIELAPRMEPRAVLGTPLTEVWTRKVGRGLGGVVAWSDTVVYVGAADRHVIAVDLRNGIERWSSRVLGPIAEGVAIDAGRAYTHTERPDGRVYGIHLVTGMRAWDTQVGLAAAAPALVHGALVTATRLGQVIVLEPATGRVRWRRTVGVARAPAFEGPGNSVIIATIDSLFRLSLTDGKVLERRKSPGTVLSGWAIHGAERIAGTTDSLVIGLGADSLAKLWSVELDAPVIGLPLIRGDTAYAITRIGTLYRIPLSATPVAERLISLRTAFLASPVFVKDWIVAGSADGLVFGFNLDGTIAWQTRIQGPIELSPLPLSDGFLAIGGRGDLHRYRL